MSDGKYPVRTRFGEMLRQSQLSHPGSGGAGVGVASASPVLFKRDRWVLTAGGAQTKTLTYLPLDDSLHLYLNGIGQDEGDDYTLSSQTLSVLAAMGALTDDVLWVRYAYEGDSPVFVPESLDFGISDDFDRVDGTSELANRSDGGLWTVGADSDMEIFSNRLGRPTSGIGSGSIAIWADYGYTSTVTVQFDFARTGFAALYAHIAIDEAGTQGYEVQFYPFDGGYIIIKNSGGTVIVNQLTGSSWTDGVERTAVITFDYATGDITVSVDGTTYVTYTDTGTLPTATGLTLFPGGSYTGDGMYFDNLLVTGTA